MESEVPEVLLLDPTPVRCPSSLQPSHPRDVLRAHLQADFPSVFRVAVPGCVSDVFASRLGPQDTQNDFYCKKVGLFSRDFEVYRDEDRELDKWLVIDTEGGLFDDEAYICGARAATPSCFR